MPWKTPQRLVVPIDFSDLSLDALNTALEMSDPAAAVLVLHVLADLSPVETGELWRTVDHEVRKRHALQAMEERFQGDRYARAAFHTLIGDPGHVIADFAVEQKADLIVIPSHGRTGLRRLLIGSTAERVVRHAHCPVLVLRK